MKYGISTRNITIEYPEWYSRLRNGTCIGPWMAPSWTIPLSLIRPKFDRAMLLV